MPGAYDILCMVFNHVYIVLAMMYYQSKSSVRRQKGVTGYSCKYTDRPFCLLAKEVFFSTKLRMIPVVSFSTTVQ